MVDTLAEAAGNELRALLAPITPVAFVGEYWGKKPLHVKGFRDKYKGFFNGETFSRALTAPGPFVDDFIRASFDKKMPTGTSAAALTPEELRSSAFRASVEQAVPLYDAGATLCVSQVETRVPHLATFLAAIKRQLGFPGKASFNAYLSPPGSGFNWHFDSRIASTLQIEGSKTWRFSNRPVIDWPRANGSLRADGTAQYADATVVALEWEHLAPFDESDTSEVLLEPGDLLILPAGTWHEACGGAGGSLALNLSFTPVSYTALMRNLLDTLLTPESGWRSPAPLLPRETPGEVDPAGVAAIGAEIERAVEALQSLKGDSAAVVRLWQSFVQNPNPGFPGLKSPPVATAPVLPTERLRIRDDGNVYAVLAEGGTQLCVVVGTSRAIELTGVAVRFVQRMLVEREFLASETLAWSDGAPFAWADVEEMLTRLKGEGLIVEARS